MKLALVSVDELEALPPLGLGYIASYLRKYADFDKTVIVDKEDQIERIRRERPDVVGISATTLDFKKAEAIARRVKEELDLPTLVGGFHVTALPHRLPECFDVGVLGEGELTMVDLVRLYEGEGEFSPKGLEGIDGICYHDGSVKMTARRGNIEPLDSVPYPARDLMKIEEYYLKPARHTYDKLSVGTSIITTRGCLFNCVFCSQTGFWQHTMRFHSPEYVVGEMKELVARYPRLEIIRIMDDLFAVKKARIKRISELVREAGLHERVEFHVFGRTNLMDEEMARYLKEMNVRYINFGFESGSEKVLGYLKRNTVKLAHHYKALELCGKHGLKADGSFIFGAPNETREDVEKTFQLVRHPNLKATMFFKLSPLPSSALWDEALKKGFVSEDMDWDLLKAEFNPQYPYMGMIPKEEFFREVVPMITREYEVKNRSHLPRIRLSHLLHPGLWRRFLTNWRGFSREFLQRLYKSALKRI